MPQKPNAQLIGIRRDVSQAARIVANLFPQQRERDVALRILADAIICAARVAPASWGVSLFEDRLCLNVGRGAVLQFDSDEILFIVTGRLFSTLSRRNRDLFRANRVYKFVPDALEGWLSAASLSKYDLFKRAHTDLIERAAQGRKTCLWPHAHSPSVVELLGRSNLRVPAPDYTIVSNHDSMVDIDETDHVTSEGRRNLHRHLVIERDPKLARRKKEVVMAATGRLACEVCSFDFEETYGSVGHAFAEVHHLKPLGTSNMPSIVRLSDLAIVCSNCHRMLHRGNPLFSLSELRDRL